MVSWHLIIESFCIAPVTASGSSLLTSSAGSASRHTLVRLLLYASHASGYAALVEVLGIVLPLVLIV